MFSLQQIARMLDIDAILDLVETAEAKVRTRIHAIDPLSPAAAAALAEAFAILDRAASIRKTLVQIQVTLTRNTPNPDNPQRPNTPNTPPENDSATLIQKTLADIQNCKNLSASLDVQMHNFALHGAAPIINNNSIEPLHPLEPLVTEHSSHYSHSSHTSQTSVSLGSLGSFPRLPSLTPSDRVAPIRPLQLNDTTPTTVVPSVRCVSSVPSLVKSPRACPALPWHKLPQYAEETAARADNFANHPTQHPNPSPEPQTPAFIRASSSITNLAPAKPIGPMGRTPPANDTS